jgi:ketosteroid isomerase-like protein
MSNDSIRKLAERFFDAVERGDLETVQAIYAPDAIIWHNSDGIAGTVADNLRTLTNFIKFVPERRYAESRLDVFDGGFVEQHVLKGTLASGKQVSLDACIVCKVKDGRITRLDEYFDSAALAAWR